MRGDGLGLVLQERFRRGVLGALCLGVGKQFLVGGGENEGVVEMG